MIQYMSVSYHRRRSYHIYYIWAAAADEPPICFKAEWLVDVLTVEPVYLIIIVVPEPLMLLFFC